jgi:hypothetical protein
MMAITTKDDPIDRTVRAWMAEHGIEEKRVTWYRVSRESEPGSPNYGVAVLELKMMMNEFTEPAAAGEERSNG